MLEQNSPPTRQKLSPPFLKLKGWWTSFYIASHWLVERSWRTLLFFSRSQARPVMGARSRGGRYPVRPPSPPFLRASTREEARLVFPSSSSYPLREYISRPDFPLFMPYPRACDLMTVPYNKAYYGVSRHDIALVHLIATHVSSARTIS